MFIANLRFATAVSARDFPRFAPSALIDSEILLQGHTLSPFVPFAGMSR